MDCFGRQGGEHVLNPEAPGFFLEFCLQQRAHANQEPPSAALTQVDKTVTCPVLTLSVYKQ